MGILAACHALIHLCLFRLRLISSHLTYNFKRVTESARKRIALLVPEVQEALCFWVDPMEVSRGVKLGFVAPNQTLMIVVSEIG